jgi:hypothetical protein
MRGMKLLSSILISNGLFSFASGCVLIWQSEGVSKQIIRLPTLGISMVGLGLVLFGLTVLWVGSRQSKETQNGNIQAGVSLKATLTISLMDFIWVLSTLPLIATDLVTKPLGAISIAVISAIVGLFGLLQVIGLDQQFRQQDGRRRICFSYNASSSAEELWSRLARLEEISNFIPDLKSSRLVTGTELEVGTVRECVDVSGQQWMEECVEVGDMSFTLRFLTEAPNYPYPLTDMTGGWQVRPSATGSMVQVWWLARGKSVLPDWLLFPLMALKAEVATPTIIASLDSGGPISSGTLKRLKRLYIGGVC